MTNKQFPALAALVIAFGLASTAFAADPTPTPRPVRSSSVKSSKSNSSDRAAPPTPTPKPAEGKPSKEQRVATPASAPNER
jgi:hypothetical protein